MSGQALRNFALALLDDEQGINSEAWDTLRDLLYDDEQNDIVEAVQSQDGRFYLPGSAVGELRQIVKRD
jgi:hypothetical protein